MDMHVALRRPAAGSAVLFIVYGVLSLLLDPEAHLGTDTGAKVYTLEVMEQRGSFEPDIGYWAEHLDPDGSAHAVYQTRRHEDGSWVAVTTLPVLQAAKPLYELGGYRATLLLPMLGSVGAALAARQLARRMGGSEANAVRVFWLVGLGSPMIVYALDFWEHSIGVACMVGAVATMASFLDEPRRGQPVLAGLLLGIAATLRNETFVYAVVLVGLACCWVLVRDRSVRWAVGGGALAVVAFGVPWAANAALEQTLAGLSRSSRATGTAAAVGESVDSRIEDSVQTLLGLTSGAAATSALLGVVLVVVTLGALRAERRGDRRFAVVALGAVGLTYVLDALAGLGFIPGLLIAFPIAIAGLVLSASDRRTRYPWAVAVLALPIVYAFQYLGGAPAQWGGRYTLTSGILLGVVALIAAAPRQPTVTGGLLVLSFVVSWLGAAWTIARTHQVDAFFDEVIAHSEPVVIARQAFLLREAGATAVGRRWLSADRESVFREAVEIAREVGEPAFTVLEWDGAAPPDGALPADVHEVRRRELRFVDTPVGLVTYEFAND